MQIGIDAVPSVPAMSVCKSKIRIALIEGHAILREGLKALIEMELDFEIIGAFDNVEDGLSGIRQMQPDVVVMDLALPARSGVDLLAEIQMISPRTRKLVLSAREDEEYIRATLNFGADGYILKNVDRAELMLAIRTVFAGRQFLCKSVAKVRSGHPSGSVPQDQRLFCRTVAPVITEREREVLTRIALGNSNKVIARELGVSPKTVEKHRSNLMRKLQLHNAAAITMFAIRNGMTGSAASSGRPRTIPDSLWTQPAPVTAG